VSLRNRLKPQTPAEQPAPAPAEANVHPLVQTARYTLPDGRIGTYSVGVSIAGASFDSFAVDGQATPVLIPTADAAKLQRVPEPPKPASIVPPDAPASKPEIAAEQPKPAEEEKPKKQRAAKKDEEALAIYVDCAPTTAAKSLVEYVNGLVAQIRVKFDVLDVRLAPNAEHPLAYAKWKGILAAMIRETPPAPGVYVAIGVERNDALAEAVTVLDAHVVARGI
jgi:hypothetical protein